jgi:hypothetical protein
MLPFRIKVSLYRLAYDSRLVRDILHIFIQTVFSSMRLRARQSFGIKKAKCGAVTELYSASMQGRVTERENESLPPDGGISGGGREKGEESESLLRKSVGIQLACQCLHSGESPAAVEEFVLLCCASGDSDGKAAKASRWPDPVPAPASVA